MKLLIAKKINGNRISECIDVYHSYLLSVFAAETIKSTDFQNAIISKKTHLRISKNFLEISSNILKRLIAFAI